MSLEIVALPRSLLSILSAPAVLVLAAAPAGGNAILLNPVQIELAAGEVRNLRVKLGDTLQAGYLYKGELPPAEASWRTVQDPEARQIYRLNLGRFQDCPGRSSDETDEQRRVIVLALRNKDHGLGLDALRNKLLQDLSAHRPLGFDPAEYSEFTLHPARF